LEAFEASSQGVDVGNDPLAYVEEAERLMRKQVRENRDRIDNDALSIHLLCRILIARSKYAEAKRILNPCLQNVARVFGPSHLLTKDLLNLDAQISPYI